VGGGGGQIKKGGHHIAAVDEEMADLLLAIAQKTGAEVTTFGTSSTPMDI
jgi:hypothetical protein